MRHSTRVELVQILGQDTRILSETAGEAEDPNL